jgi:hypothetical protein
MSEVSDKSFIAVDMVERFVRALGVQINRCIPPDKITVPVDLAFVLAWKPIAISLLQTVPKNGLFALVHLSSCRKKVKDSEADRASARHLR